MASETEHCVYIHYYCPKFSVFFAYRLVLSLAVEKILHIDKLPSVDRMSINNDLFILSLAYLSLFIVDLLWSRMYGTR